jgi:ADP-ribose pyrophosphatase YjhB (NUDIX family)
MEAGLVLKRLRESCSTRGDLVTLGVQGVLIDQASRVLLVRHRYRPGWHFPGGGVERDETIEHALERELSEEVGVRILETPRLFGVYSHFETYPGDHIVLFVVDRWQQEGAWKPNLEIAEQRLFDVGALPETLAPGTARRLKELLEKMPQASAW